MVPSFRTVFAAERRAQFNVLIKAHGGVGDVVCSEPAVRYATEHFKASKVSLLTPYPEIFRHLKFHEVWTNPHDEPVRLLHTADGDYAKQLNLEQYLMFQTIDVTNELSNEFICHALMSGVDYASLNMWRLVLPNELKRIRLEPSAEEVAAARQIIQPNDVVVHPGKTWKSRTFPKKWWDGVIQGLVKAGARPVLIGGVVDKGRASTIDVETDGCLDLRYKQSLMETCAVLHEAKVLVTNDSSPLHMAATGNAWIGYLSTVKHRDHLTHWRQPDPKRPNYGGLGFQDTYQLRDDGNIYGWRQQDFSRGNLWSGLDVCPNNPKTVHVDDCDVQDLLSWLPDPMEVVSWAINKLS